MLLFLKNKQLETFLHTNKNKNKSLRNFIKESFQIGCESGSRFLANLKPHLLLFMSEIRLQILIYTIAGSGRLLTSRHRWERFQIGCESGSRFLANLKPHFLFFMSEIPLQFSSIQMPDPVGYELRDTDLKWILLIRALWLDSNLLIFTVGPSSKTWYVIKHDTKIFNQLRFPDQDTVLLYNLYSWPFLVFLNITRYTVCCCWASTPIHQYALTRQFVKDKG